MAAEALNENNKPYTALVYLNMVGRGPVMESRVYYRILPLPIKATFCDIIFNERRHELAMEGWRFWGPDQNREGNLRSWAAGFITGTHEHLPIPQSEIDISQEH